MSWVIDPAHSQIQFSVRHMMISHVRGRFDSFSGTVKADDNNPADAEVEIRIAAASINTSESKRDAHLKSPDFLDAERYPYLLFRGKRLELLDDTHGRLIGDLTIRDVTREVVLDVRYLGQAKTPWGTINAGFEATTEINRKDWGLTWNVALETGGWLVSDEIKVNIELELIKQAEDALPSETERDQALAEA